ncbi:homoserine kinase [Qipengyuania sediminis]|uniref:homoserine kinase n=1 Tax=Qipengyuania sediminis TaxID=1532023 RepID=UPI00105A1B95|nr:homoserine kinase [Qipengyuania sediminis]
MAVYTPLGAETLTALIAEYDVGALISAKGIAEGISNSNWLVETRRDDGRAGRYILTLYERRIDESDLPYFLALLDHLAAKGCAVPATIKDRAGASLRRVEGKAAALIAFLPGVSPSAPTPAQAHAVGAALAQVHLASRDFPLRRADQLDPAAGLATLRRCGAQALAGIDPALAGLIQMAEEVVSRWPGDLPQATIHSDLFPDNVLMLGTKVTGLIDFYFACDGMMAYDLAVTHAAWSFSQHGEEFDPAIASALLAGYESLRALTSLERETLPLLAQGACLRFAVSRAEDWLSTPAGAFRKDPTDFLRRLLSYRAEGGSLFASA